MSVIINIYSYIDLSPPIFYYVEYQYMIYTCISVIINIYSYIDPLPPVFYYVE